MRTVNRLIERAFSGENAPCNEIFKAGVRACLIHHVLGISVSPPPMRDSTDAATYRSGVYHGDAIWSAACRESCTVPAHCVRESCEVSVHCG